MRPKLKFFASGEPKGQPRVRAVMRGNRAGVTDPGTADGWKFAVRAAAQDKWDGVPFAGPVKLNLVFHFRRPNKHHRSSDASKPLKPDAPYWHTTKPDRDNLEKAVMDALTTLGVWADDCQVCCGSNWKIYTNGTPGCRITVSEIENE